MHFSVLSTLLVSVLLSLGRLLRITGERVPPHIPMLALSASLAALWGASLLDSVSAQCVVYLIFLFCLFALFRVCGKKDFNWFIVCVKPSKTLF